MPDQDGIAQITIVTGTIVHSQVLGESLVITVDIQSPVIFIDISIPNPPLRITLETD